jgi:hypothetical protein
MYHQFTKINPQQPQAAGRSLIRLTRKKIRRGGIHVPTCINPIPRAPGRLGSVAYRLRPLIFTASESAPHLLPLLPLSLFIKLSKQKTINSNTNQLQNQNPAIKSDKQANMHGSDCPKCGAASDGGKSCGSCGAVRALCPLYLYSILYPLLALPSHLRYYPLQDRANFIAPIQSCPN